MPSIPWILFVAVPTLPFYLAGAALVWWPLRPRVGALAALAFAVLVTLAIGFAVPLAANLRTERDYASATGADVEADPTFRLVGDLRLETYDSYQGSLGWRANEGPSPDRAAATTCGRLCRSVLAQPGVASVTVLSPSVQQGSTSGVRAVTYRRAEAGCVPIEASKDFIDFGTRSSGEDPVGCVASGPPPGHADLRLISTRDEREKGAMTPSFLMQRAEIIDDRDRTRFRRTAAYAGFIAVPLAVEITLDEHDGPITVHRSPRSTSKPLHEWLPGNALLQAVGVEVPPRPTGK